MEAGESAGADYTDLLRSGGAGFGGDPFFILRNVDKSFVRTATGAKIKCDGAVDIVSLVNLVEVLGVRVARA